MSTLKSSLADNPDLQDVLNNQPRTDGRKDDQAREIKITPGFTKHAHGSVLIETGDTRVICTAMVEDQVPAFKKGKKQGGWVTAEYAMLPGSTNTRKRRSNNGNVDGRSQEIQRLIGRSLRSVVDLKAMGERTIWLDCDVIQADGGTRTASITGAYVAMILAMRHLRENGKMKGKPVKEFLSATSAGIVRGRPMLDLKYDEDSTADVDMNFVMLGNGQLVEVQGTAEGATFSRVELNALLDLAEIGGATNVAAQKAILGDTLF